MKSPAFQFYPGDFLSDLNVIVLTGQEVGAYALLMSVCWLENGIPNDMDDMAHVARMEPSAFIESWGKRLERCFVLRDDGRWDHPRLQAERLKQQEFSKKMSDAANRRHSGDQPKKPRGTKKAMPTHQEGNALQSSSSSPSSLTTDAGYEPDFEMLWKAYPKRHGGSNKAGSYSYYLGHLKKGVAFDVMFEGVKRYALFCIADGSVGTKYVKDCQTFLGPRKCFLDEHAIGSPPKPPGVIPLSKEERDKEHYRKRGYV